MTGHQKIEQAFLLSEFVIEIALANIKKKLGKNATKKNIQIELQKRLRYL